MFKFSGWDYFKFTILFAILTNVYFMRNGSAYGSREAGFTTNEYQLESTVEKNIKSENKELVIEKDLVEPIIPAKPVLNCDKNCMEECKINSEKKLDIIQCLDACACNTQATNIKDTKNNNDVSVSSDKASVFSFSNLLFFASLFLFLSVLSYSIDKNSDLLDKYYREIRKKLNKLCSNNKKELLYEDDEELDNEYRKLTDI